MKKIIVNTDFNIKEKKVLEYAFNLANDLDHSIIIYKMINAEFSPPELHSQGVAIPQDFESIIEEEKKRTEEHFNDWVREIKRKIPFNNKVELMIKESTDAFHLSEEANKPDVSHVVISGTEKDNLFTRLTNENYLNIIKSTLKPVWIIPPGYDYKSINKLVYSTEYNKEDLQAIKKLVYMMSPFSPRIIAVNVTDDLGFKTKIEEDGYKKMVDDKIGYQGFETYRVKGDDVIEGVQDFVAKTQADVIVLLKENKDFFEKMFSKSITKEMIYKASVPLMIFSE